MHMSFSDARENLSKVTFRIVTADKSPAFGVLVKIPDVWPGHIVTPAANLSSPDAETVALEINGQQHAARVLGLDPSGRLAHIELPLIGLEVHACDIPTAPLDGQMDGVPRLETYAPPLAEGGDWVKGNVFTADKDDPAILTCEFPHKLVPGWPIITNTNIVVAIAISATEAIRPNCALLQKEIELPAVNVGASLTYTPAVQYNETKLPEMRYTPPTLTIQDACGDHADHHFPGQSS